jgi:hypothetical protein
LDLLELRGHLEQLEAMVYLELLEHRGQLGFMARQDNLAVLELQELWDRVE